MTRYINAFVVFLDVQIYSVDHFRRDAFVFQAADPLINNKTNVYSLHADAGEADIQFFLLAEILSWRPAARRLIFHLYLTVSRIGRSHLRTVDSDIIRLSAVALPYLYSARRTI